MRWVFSQLINIKLVLINNIKHRQTTLKQQMCVIKKHIGTFHKLANNF